MRRRQVVITIFLHWYVPPRIDNCSVSALHFDDVRRNGVLCQLFLSCTLLSTPCQDNSPVISTPPSELPSTLPSGLSFELPSELSSELSSSLTAIKLGIEPSEEDSSSNI